MLLFAHNRKSFLTLHRMVFSFALILALMVFSVSSVQANPPQLKVQGNALVTASGGCTVRLTGVNVDSTEWDAAGEYPSGGSFMTQVQEAVQYWNVNLIRVAIDQDWWDGYAQSSRGATSQAAYQAMIDSVVAYCNAHNIYCDLDLHWSGDGPTGSAIQQYSMPDENSVTFWTSMAARYANNPSVLFDLFNEPFPNSWAVWLNGGTANEGFQTPGFQALLNTVRGTVASGSSTLASGTKAENICIVGGQQYSYYYVGMNPVVDVAGGNGVVYSAHIYNNKSNNTATGWQTNIDPALAYGPVLVEEFGNSNAENDNGAYINTLLPWINGANDKNYVYSAMAWDLDLSAGPQLLTSWSSTLAAPVTTGTGWVLTSYEGQQVYGWLKGITYPTCSSGPTNTPTRTATTTLTPTMTATKTPTPTATYTSSATASPTKTATSTPSSTSTAVLTATSTPTASSTSTRTPTATPTVTKTLTLTATITQTATVTSTLTATQTFQFSPTVTLTPTVTASPTKTLTAVSTPSATLSPTTTLSPTMTSSPTVTPTAQFTSTQTPTTTATATASPTSAFTSTLTFTPSLTASPTKTFTASATPTRTATLVFTATPTATFTATLGPTVSLQLTSSSPTIEPGQAFTYEFNLTITGGPAQNAVLTQTLPAGLTVSGFITGPSGVVNGNQITWNLSSLPVGTTQLEISVDVDPSAAGGTDLTSQGTLTYSGGSASSNSASVSVTAFTPTPTASTAPTWTFTPTPPASTGGGTNPPVLFPNPTTGPGPVTIQLPNYPGSSIVTIQVFTTAFRMVNSLPPKSEPGGSDVALPLTDRKGAPLADGLYYVLVTSPAGKSIVKLLILR